MRQRYGEDCPVAVVYRATWPDELIIRGTLADVREKVRAAKITRTALVIVGRVLAGQAFDASRLYDPSHRHLFRPHRPAQTVTDLSRAAATAWPSPALVRANLAAAPMSLIDWRASPPISAEMRLPCAIPGLSLLECDYLVLVIVSSRHP